MVQGKYDDMKDETCHWGVIGGRAWVRVGGHDNVRLRCLKVKLMTLR